MDERVEKSLSNTTDDPALDGKNSDCVVFVISTGKNYKYTHAISEAETKSGHIV